MLGAHGTGSVYMIHTAPALPRVKAKVGPPAAISNAVVLKNGNLQLNSRGFADLGTTLSPTTEMTLLLHPVRDCPGLHCYCPRPFLCPAPGTRPTPMPMRRTRP